ncbi:MAG: HNH endonuclease [Deltaproteobacteria bacterium]|nr:HNH endonuclease [Deltaproteobacteria bacterium]
MNWTEDQLKLALALYCQLPFGKMHSRNQDIIRLAERIGRTPSAVAMKLVNFASLDPEIVNSGRAGLGNASAMDRKVWDKFQKNWDAEILVAADNLGIVPEVTPDASEEILPLSIDTSRRAEVEVRKKQYIFRRMILSSYSGVCCMSGLSEPRLLVASHIVPWKNDADNRLNPKNGLCLSSLHDKAFDTGLITVFPDYSIAVSPEIRRLTNDKFIQDALVSCHGKLIRLPEKFHPSKEFLEWHSQVRFLR